VLFFAECFSALGKAFAECKMTFAECLDKTLGKEGESDSGCGLKTYSINSCNRGVGRKRKACEHALNKT
jgi:hypothetical protein